eukprot:TRINITY_DN493_c0_g1_i1.p1 TRINITY_DN493_c0_g1~~TRINITY_DN493_c0_g1_i1.p1  ORF type:complete len:473 (-),score=145.74 TRINITY_DN493_c0_g1_i1:269-1483(-)
MSAEQPSGSELSRADFHSGVVAAALSVAGSTVLAPGEAQAASGRGPSNTGSGSRVNKDPQSLLRQGLPINCKPVFDLQEAIDSVKYDTYRKDWSRALNDCKQAGGIVSKKRKDLLAAVRPTEKAKGEQLLQTILDKLTPLEAILKSKEGTGTVAERIKLDDAYAAQEEVADAVGSLQELMVPADYVKELEANIPSEFDKLPRLLGRATVEFVLEKPTKGDKFDVEGTLYDQAKLVMVIDGYNAPITAGCFLDLVQKGFYKGLAITRSDGFVVQTGDPDPEGTKHGYEDRIVPLEIFVSGDKYPMYSLTTEDDSRGYASTILPFQAYGALGMARTEFEADSASSQFFWLLFESDLTPAGKNLLDGRYTEFGYTVKNAELLKDVKEGDIIVSTKVLQGAENFKKSK